MSTFYNYDGLFDVMTDLLNKKCPETQIDKNISEYIALKQQLNKHKMDNINNSAKEKKKRQQYNQDVFSSQRINDEKPAETAMEKQKEEAELKTIYPNTRKKFLPYPIAHPTHNLFVTNMAVK